MIKNLNITLKKIDYKLITINQSINYYYLNNQFLDIKIKNYILKYDKYTLYFKYKNTDLYYYSKKSNYIKKKINLIFNIIENLRIFCNNDKPLIIHIYETNLKKKFPLQKKDLTIYEINSGLTYHNNNNENGIIITFRNEELYKVLIHEIIHAFKCDYNIEDKVSNFKNINEAYTDCLACIIYLKFYYKLHKNQSFNRIFKSFIEYNNQKCFQIMNYCNIFEQKTNVLSYFFIKGVLLHNLKETFTMYNHYTNNLKLNNNTIYYNLINNNYKKYLNFLHYKYKKKIFKDKSLRMMNIDLYS